MASNIFLCLTRRRMRPRAKLLRRTLNVFDHGMRLASCLTRTIRDIGRAGAGAQLLQGSPAFRVLTRYVAQAPLAQDLLELR